MPRTVHPNYRKAVNALVGNQGIIIEELDYDVEGGFINPDALPVEPGDIAALVIPQPNFFGVLEEVDALTDWAHNHGALVIGVVNPVALALLAPPGEWGEDGADIVCGEGQSLGIPLSSGGPYYGFMCCKQAFVRQMPGRIIGRTVDLDGKPGFTLTLQAREQHIRRSKATSNICTNQGLMVTASTIHMALLGPAGLEQVAAKSYANTQALVQKLTAVDGVSPVFNRPVFHEAVLRLDAPLQDVMRALNAQNVLPGYALAKDYPELANTMLVCATETKSEADLIAYVEHLERILSKQKSFA
jgi:glycine dehydrogenase subunit 1